MSHWVYSLTSDNMNPMWRRQIFGGFRLIKTFTKSPIVFFYIFYIYTFNVYVLSYCLSWGLDEKNKKSRRLATPRLVDLERVHKVAVYFHSGLWFLIKCFNYVDWVLFFKCWTHNSSVYKLEISFLLLLLLWVKHQFISSTFISAIYQVILKRENTTREQHPCKSLVFIVSLNWPWLWFSLSILVILKLFVYTVLYVLLNKPCCPCRVNTAQWSHHTEHISQPDSYTP